MKADIGLHASDQITDTSLQDNFYHTYLLNCIYKHSNCNCLFLNIYIYVMESGKDYRKRNFLSMSSGSSYLYGVDTKGLVNKPQLQKALIKVIQTVSPCSL